MLLKISKIFLHVSLFSVVIVLTSTFFPFIGGKDYFFRFAVELALIFFILWWAFEAGEGEALVRFKNIFSKPLFIAVSVFVFAFLLASIFAYDPHAAFWSNYERGEGGFQMLHYYAFFALLVFLMETKEDWRLLFKTSLIAAALMIFYGVFADLGWADNFISQYQGGGPQGWWQRLTAGRFQGSLGNPAYVAPYLMFSIFYALYLWASNKSALRLVYGIGYGILAVVFFLFLILSGTRGTFLGLGVAFFFFLAYLILFSYSRLRKWFVAALILFILGAGFLFINRHSDFVKNLPSGRLLDISLSADSAQTRFWTWGSAWHGFLERPILGWGPENFTPVFDKYFDPRHFKPGQSTETWFDRAHSVYFDYVTETGILGLLSYLGIFAVFYVEFFRKTFTQGELSFTERALMFSLPLGYLVQALVIFDVLPMYINLFAFFAFGYFCLYHKSHHLLPSVQTDGRVRRRRKDI